MFSVQPTAKKKILNEGISFLTNHDDRDSAARGLQMLMLTTKWRAALVFRFKRLHQCVAGRVWTMCHVVRRKNKSVAAEPGGIISIAMYTKKNPTTNTNPPSQWDTLHSLSEFEYPSFSVGLWFLEAGLLVDAYPN